MDIATELWEQSLLREAASDSSQGVTPDTLVQYASGACIMNSVDIANFIDMTAHMHNCDIADISYEYEPIISDDGQLVISEMNLIFRMKTLVNDMVNLRTIHKVRVAVPQETQQRAKTMIEEYKKSLAQTAHLVAPSAREPVTRTRVARKVVVASVADQPRSSSVSLERTKVRESSSASLEQPKDHEPSSAAPAKPKRVRRARRTTITQ